MDGFIDQLKALKGRRILLTGDTGFKGNWLTAVLCNLDIEVVGFSDEYKFRKYFQWIDDLPSYTCIRGDVRDRDKLSSIIEENNICSIIHLAAQPLVKYGLLNPFETYDINVNGTLNVLEEIRLNPNINNALIVTTDKVYFNEEIAGRKYTELDRLNGKDPYSNSKSVCDLIYNTYNDIYFKPQGKTVSSVRSGNVIGGGDFSIDRLVPDAMKALIRGRKFELRNPYSTRPYQHVLEPVFGYLKIFVTQLENSEIAGSYNIGPNDEMAVMSNSIMIKEICSQLNIEYAASVIEGSPLGSLEAVNLSLDCDKALNLIGVQQRLDLYNTIRYTIEWYKAHYEGNSTKEIVESQIKNYLDLCLNK